MTDSSQTRVRKRVLFVITQSGYGGAQRFLHTLISHLDRNRYKILAVTGESQGPDFLADSLNQLGVETLKITSLKRGISPLADLRAIGLLRRVISQFQPDTIFLTSSKAGFIGSLATVTGRLPKKPKVIYRIGGWSFNDPRPRWQRLLFIILERISARWKDFIITNNQHDFDQAKKLSILPRRGLLLIHNGLDVYKMDFLTRDEARLRLFEKISKHLGRIFQVKTVVGTIANFYPAKGLVHLIEAAQHFKNQNDIVFVIIGDGPEKENLKLKIKNLKLEKKIFLLGQIPNAHQLLTAFDIFVLSSVKEGFPWVLIEAMAAKLPVIATAVGAAPEIIADGKNGLLVEPANPRDLAQKIREIAADEFRRREMGIQAHQTVLFKFSLDKMINQFEEIL